MPKERVVLYPPIPVEVDGKTFHITDFSVRHRCEIEDCPEEAFFAVEAKWDNAPVSTKRLCWGHFARVAKQHGIRFVPAAGPLDETPCPACRLPQGGTVRRRLTDQIIRERVARGETNHDVTAWTCEACGLPAWSED